MTRSDYYVINTFRSRMIDFALNSSCTDSTTYTTNRRHLLKNMRNTSTNLRFVYSRFGIGNGRRRKMKKTILAHFEEKTHLPVAGHSHRTISTFFRSEARGRTKWSLSWSIILDYSLPLGWYKFIKVREYSNQAELMGDQNGIRVLRQPYSNGLVRIPGLVNPPFFRSLALKNRAEKCRFRLELT